MQRRGFLISALSLLGANTLAAQVGARPASTGAPAPMLLQRSPLAGYQYHQGPSLWPDLAIGQPLRLTREPDNPYDPRAVRIDWNGHKLGYIPRRDNAAVSQLLDRRQAVSARIAMLKETPDPWRRVEVEVWVGGGPPEE